MFVRPGRSAGFTLIELLVVIVIIATLAGMAVLSLGGSDVRAWKGETQRLAGVLQLVVDRAVIDNSHYGVVFNSDGYSVVRYDPTSLEWQSPEADAETASTMAQRFAVHQLPGNMRVEVLQQAELPSAASDEDTEDPVPQFIALASGEVLPAELAVVLLEDREVSRAASISYSSLYGLQLQWQTDDY
ncbi:type II secretion system minor pseudopilin GspH [Microbulbifer sp. TYP-18]|uniref:type II secretion system minor pseudopilin GspH n=1 Tax=Microbulbifer sp. TYP-18 TaxID=3230024 RepID=UPI0034C5ED3B